MTRSNRSSRRPARPSRPKRGRPTGPGRGERSAPPKGSLHEMRTHKPFCSPSRDIVTGALSAAGIKVYYFSEEVLQSTKKDFGRRMQIERRNRENLKYGPAAAMYLPMAWEATFYVKPEQANWADYVLEATRDLMVVKGRGDKRNREWADARDHKLPKPWDDPKCAEGQKAKKEWQEFVDEFN